MQRATFAAGCYWGTERFFRKEFGAHLKDIQVGFMGGGVDAPSYREVCSGQTGHAEVLSFEYDTAKVSYDELLKLFFRMHNPTTKDRQGNDVGTQYRSSVFAHTDEQRAKAEAMIAKLNDRGDSFGDALRKVFGADAKVVTKVETATNFFPAHEEHQDYLTKNPGGYCNHRLYW